MVAPTMGASTTGFCPCCDSEGSRGEGLPSRDLRRSCEAGVGNRRAFPRANPTPAFCSLSGRNEAGHPPQWMPGFVCGQETRMVTRRIFEPIFTPRCQLLCARMAGFIVTPIVHRFRPA